MSGAVSSFLLAASTWLKKTSACSIISNIRAFSSSMLFGIASPALGFRYSSPEKTDE